MCRAVVFTFDTQGEANKARVALKDLERRGSLALEDALVLVKDAQGQVQRLRDKSRGVLIGALIGAGAGVLLMFMFPLVGVVFGAGAGALLGKVLTGRGADGDLVTDTEAGLARGTSALLLSIREGDMTELGTALRPFALQIYESSLSPEHLAELEHALHVPVHVENPVVLFKAGSFHETQAAVS